MIDKTKPPEIKEAIISVLRTIWERKCVNNQLPAHALIIKDMIFLHVSKLCSKDEFDTAIAELITTGIIETGPTINDTYIREAKNEYESTI